MVSKGQELHQPGHGEHSPAGPQPLPQQGPHVQDRWHLAPEGQDGVLKLTGWGWFRPAVRQESHKAQEFGQKPQAEQHHSKLSPFTLPVHICLPFVIVRLVRRQGEAVELPDLQAQAIHKMLIKLEAAGAQDEVSEEALTAGEGGGWAGPPTALRGHKPLLQTPQPPQLVSSQHTEHIWSFAQHSAPSTTRALTHLKKLFLEKSNKVAVAAGCRELAHHGSDPAAQALLKVPAGLLVVIFPLSKHLIKHIPLLFERMKGSVTGEVGTIVSFWLKGDSLSRGQHHQRHLGNTALIGSSKAALQGW